MDSLKNFIFILGKHDVIKLSFLRTPGFNTKCFGGPEILPPIMADICCAMTLVSSLFIRKDYIMNIMNPYIGVKELFRHNLSLKK